MTESVRKNFIRCIILAAAVIMIIAGLTGGAFRDVFTRAVMICMECIGIG